MTPYVQFVDYYGKIICSFKQIPEVPPEGSVVKIAGEKAEVLDVVRYLHRDIASGTVKHNYAVEVRLDYSLDHTEQS